MLTGRPPPRQKPTVRRQDDVLTMPERAGKDVDSSVDTLPNTLAGYQELEEPDPLVGTRYQAVRQMGRGGMGTVYLAKHRDLGRSFAVKVLSKRMSADPLVVERMRREARTASQLRHPGIVDVTDFGETRDGRTFIVMEYLEGETLFQAIERRGRVEQAEALAIGLRLCEALGAAHDHDIIHRDVKPANIILNAEGSAFPVKIVDFGISLSPEHATERLTKVGAMPGTPVYMAPEQATTRTATVLTDVYALGVVLYEMLTGSPPFAGSSPIEVLSRKREEDPEPPSRRAPGAEIDEAVEALVLRAIARDPAGRFQSMRELGAAIEASLETRRPGAPVAAALAAEASSPERRRARPPYAAIVALMAACAVASGFLVAYVARRDGQGDRAEPASAIVAPGDAGARRGAVDATAPGAARESARSPATPAVVDAGAGAASDAEAPLDTPAETGPPAGEGSHAATTDERRQLASRYAADGQRLLAARQLAAARQAYTRAAHLEPGSATIQGGLGRIAFEQGRYAEAAGHLERALKQRPRDTSLRITLGSTYLRTGQTAQAVRQWDQVLRQDPDNAAARRLLSSVGQER